MELTAEELVDWPPFYTYSPPSLQLNADIREQQLSLWAQLVLAFCRSRHLFAITAEDLQPLIRNPRIRRSLKDDFIQALMAHMKKANLAVEDGPKTLVFWKKLDVWAAQVHKWADDHGKIGGVETVVGLVSGDDTRREEFFDMPPAYMMAVLQILERTNKATLFEVSGSYAVKFLQ